MGKEKELRRKRVILFTGIIAILLASFAFARENRVNELQREAVSYRLAAESALILPADNVKAIRIAEAAYKISKSPPAVVVRALSTAAYSTRERPFYTAEFSHEGEVYTAVFSPDGSKILALSLDHTAKLWDLQGNLLADLQGLKICRAVFSPDGKRILTTGRDQIDIIWPTPEGIMEWLKTAPIPKLTQKEKEDLGIAAFKID